MYVIYMSKYLKLGEATLNSDEVLNIENYCKKLRYLHIITNDVQLEKN